MDGEAGLSEPGSAVADAALLNKPGASPVSKFWKASLHKVHCANNGAWKNSQLTEEQSFG
jgi:hypothetical protein